MTWTVPKYSRTEVDRAGRLLLDRAAAYDKWIDAFQVVSNWRSSHAFPLNTFQTSLRQKARRIDAECLVAQRLKRFESMLFKLRRFGSMNLSQVQDIAGCRAVVATVDQVHELNDSYLESNMRHRLLRRDDYVAAPKSSGYRGIHLIYRYESDRRQTYNGLLVELQLRSKLQHAWATAVEAVGLFTKQSLKSSLGSSDWLRLFALMSSHLADLEGTTRVPSTPDSNRDLELELRDLSSRLNAAARLASFAHTLEVLEMDTSSSKYYLLQFNPESSQLQITGFTHSELERATRMYGEVEQANANNPGRDAVLVSVDSVESLRRAYPNYFLDTQTFADYLRSATGGAQ